MIFWRPKYKSNYSNHNVILLGSTTTSVHTTAHETILNGGTYESLVKFTMDTYPSDNAINMCYYNFYLEAKGNLILANFDYKRRIKQFYTARKRLVPFFSSYRIVNL